MSAYNNLKQKELKPRKAVKFDFGSLLKLGIVNKIEETSSPPKRTRSFSTDINPELQSSEEISIQNKLAGLRRKATI